MWDIPRLGMERVSPASAGRFLTTEPPGEPHVTVCMLVLPCVYVSACVAVDTHDWRVPHAGGRPQPSIPLWQWVPQEVGGGESAETALHIPSLLPHLKMPACTGRGVAEWRGESSLF